VTMSTESFDRDEVVDLRVTAARLWARRSWIVVSTAAFTAAFSAAAFLMTPQYRATTVLVSASSDRPGLGSSISGAMGSLGGLASLAGISVGSGSSETEEALAVLRSRQFTEAFIRDGNLMPVLFYKKWDIQKRQWTGNPNHPPTLAQVSKYFDKSVRTVMQDKKTGLISVQIDWKDPNQAAGWANELVSRLNAEMRARAIAKTTASLTYLQRELAATAAVETREAINRLMEAQINQRMLANVTEDYALRVVDRALPPDLGDVIRPQKLILLAAGPALGFMFGVFGTLAVGVVSTDVRRKEAGHAR